MKKVGIITINDNNNYGNRLQNYAVQSFLNKKGIETETILNVVSLNNKNITRIECTKIMAKINLSKIKRLIKFILNKNNRYLRFKEFNKNIKFTKKYFNFLNKKQIKNFDYFIVGSDQVWNPTFKRLSDFDLVNIETDKPKISFAASFGVSKLPENCKEKTTQALKKFKAISVREEAGKKIVEDLTGRKDVEVLVDPTMLLTQEEWDKVSKKPKQLKATKYILNYFLGELSEERKNEIERIAKENDCEVINILDPNSPFYQTGPSEFLHLEKNAFLICTDSFHSCVFAIIYNRPFIVFEREDKLVSMNSRLDTLLTKFNLTDRRYEGKITNNLLRHNYEQAYEILEQEKQKATDFLKNSMEI